jgi:hypothetical protein
MKNSFRTVACNTVVPFLAVRRTMNVFQGAATGNSAPIMESAILRTMAHPALRYVDLHKFILIWCIITSAFHCGMKKSFGTIAANTVVGFLAFCRTMSVIQGAANTKSALTIMSAILRTMAHPALR